MARTSTPKAMPDSSANLGFEAKLWLAADKLPNNMDAAEYKHVVLGPVLLKYISDTFEEHNVKLLEGKGDHGQEFNVTTHRMAVMKLAIRGIEADLGREQPGTFRRDLNPHVRADYVLANPDLNDSN